MSNPITRRDFIKKTTAAGLSFMYIPHFISRIQPSDRVRVAHIGLGGMGNSHLDWFAALPEVDVVGLCDVDSEHLNTTMQKLQAKFPTHKAEAYADYRRILDRKDVDAITCATPDHWHAQIAIMAFQAGKDVYGEKPLSYTAKEGKLMLKAMNRHKRIFQLGTQIHAGENYHRVAELIKAGAIGKVHTVRLWKTGPPPVLTASATQSPPPQLNWDWWLGPAPFHPYVPERCHFNYRYFLDYSGGVFQDFWCHIADIVWWAIEPKGLKSVSAKGEKSDGIGDTPKWIDVDYEFEGLKIHWTSKAPDVQGADKRHIGAYFEGDKGTLICDYGSRELNINGIVMEDMPTIPISIPRSPGHQQNFIDAVKSRQQPESNLAYVRRMTLPMHLGLISYRLKRPLLWNDRKEKFRKDAEANALLWREYRKGWDWI